MTQIRIEAVTGETPINVYISDVYGNNESLIGTITNTGLIPPAALFYPPSLFNTAPAIMLTLIDDRGCKKFEIIECSYGCGFDISVELESCVYTISVSAESCSYTLSVDESSCPYVVQVTSV
jgi:hypothetical protein